MKSIHYYIEISETRQRDCAGVNKRCWNFEDDDVVLLRTSQATNRLEQDVQDIQRVNELKKLGFRVCETYETHFIADPENPDYGHLYILQERARGILVDVRRNIQGENRDEIVAETNFTTMKEIANAPQEHFDRLVEDNIKIHNFGLMFDSSRPNLFYDRKIGFTNIDINDDGTCYINTGIDNKEHRVNLVEIVFGGVSTYNQRYGDTDEYKSAQKMIKLKLATSFVRFGFSNNEVSYALDMPKSELPDIQGMTFESDELEKCFDKSRDSNWVLRKNEVVSRILSYHDILCKNKDLNYYKEQIQSQINNDDMFIKDIFPKRAKDYMRKYLGNELFGLAAVLKASEDLGADILEKVVSKPYIEIVLDSVDRKYQELFKELEKEKQRRESIVTHRSEMFELFKGFQTDIIPENIKEILQLRPRALRDFIMPKVFNIENDFGEGDIVYESKPKALTFENVSLVAGIAKYLDNLDQKSSIINIDDTEQTYSLSLCRSVLNKIFDNNNPEDIEKFSRNSERTNSGSSIFKALRKVDERYNGNPRPII